jgi:phosphatidylglycerophosphate synthase
VARAGAERPRDGAERPLCVLRATAEEAAGGGRRVAGLTVVERAIKQLARLGHRVVVASDGSIPLPETLPPGVEVRAVANQAGADALCRELGWPPLVRADVVRPSSRIIADIRVEDEDSRVNAEDAIFAELLRSDLGVVARYLNKPISFRITRHLLCRLPVTPNQVTLGAAAIGLLGCALIVTGRPALMLMGLLLAHLQSVLDGCDGELARVRFQQSELGEWLDTIVDDGLNLALVASVGIGLGRLRGSPWPVVIGLLTSAMLLTYNAVTYAELVRQGDGGEVLKVRWWFNRGGDMKQVYGAGRPSLAAATMALGRRDFFLAAWVLLAAFGLYGVIQVYAVAVALPSFVGAVGQMLWRRRSPR